MKALRNVVVATCLLGVWAATTSGVSAAPRDGAPAQDPAWKAPSRAARKKNPLPATAEVLEKGRAVYKANCLSCHGESGRGDGPAAKDLEKHPGNLTDPKVQEQSDGALFWKISTGRAPMTAFGTQLSVEERWQVVHFIRKFGKNELSISSPELDAPAALRTGLTGLADAYEALVTALAGENAEAARKAVPALDQAVEALGKIDTEGLDEALARRWSASVSGLEAAVGAFATSQDLAAMRKAFAGLSGALEASWSTFGHTRPEPLYVFECTAALDGAGARWIQTKREPVNPYGKTGSSEKCVKLVKGLGAARPKDEH